MKRIWIAGMMTLLTASAFAGDLMQWQDNSLTFLAGRDFDVDPDTQETLTFEHASGWSMGDLFVFIDRIYFDGDRDISNDEQSYYGEISPRLSASKILDQDLSFLIFKDVLLAGCHEFGKESTENYLAGIGLDFDLPGFDFFQLNAYRRYDNGSDDVESYQITPVWKVTLPVGESAVIFDGFIDWVISESTENLHVCPQLKVDLGVLFGLEAKSLLAGVEYDYWKNKYGIEDTKGFNTDQSALSGIMQYHF